MQHVIKFGLLSSQTISQTHIMTFLDEFFYVLWSQGREEFMQVLLDSTSPMQKRIAAYLVLMKNPQLSELARMVNALPNIQDQQVKSFVISHITNILSSSGSETQA